MNDRIKQLAEQANAWYPMGYPSGEGGDAAWENLVIFEKEDLEKFAELIVRECMELNRKQSWDLTGVIIDVEESTGFDEVCMNTVKRVKNYLAGDDLLKHFGIQ